MPSEFGPEDHRGEIRVAISPVIEFQFGLFLLMKYRLGPKKPVPEWAVRVGSQAGDTVDAIMGFWAEADLGEADGAPYRDCGELLVAGWHTGSLFLPEIDRFLDRAEEAFAEGFEVPELRSEPAAVAELIGRRVQWLEEHGDGRRDYIQLHRALSRPIQAEWNRSGRAAAEAAARELSTRVRTENDLRVLLPANTFIHKDAFGTEISEAKERGELTLVPLGLGGGGQSFWMFPGQTVLGTGVDGAERLARRRERSERAATRLKVLSDPTRAAILYELLRSDCPSSVTELASQFGLSQPTVSVHVKMLREAGLARPERDGNQVFYRADEQAIRAYVDEALSDLLQPVEAPSTPPNLVAATA